MTTIEQLLQERLAAGQESEAASGKDSRLQLRAIVRVLASHGACLTYYLEQFHRDDPKVMHLVRSTNDLIESTREYLTSEQKAFDGHLFSASYGNRDYCGVCGEHRSVHTG